MKVVGNCPRCGFPIYEKHGKPEKSCSCWPLVDAPHFVPAPYPIYPQPIYYPPVYPWQPVQPYINPIWINPTYTTTAQSGTISITNNGGLNAQ